MSELTNDVTKEVVMRELIIDERGSVSGGVSCGGGFFSFLRYLVTDEIHCDQGIAGGGYASHIVQF